MKNIRFLVFILTIGTLVLSACGGTATPTPSVGSGKVEAMPVAFIGTVDSIAGDQWVISGATVTVDPAVVRDGPFAVGDQVKVEGVVNPDGSFTVSRVEVPAPQDVSTLPQFGDDNSIEANANVNTNQGNVNDSNVNDGIIDDENSNGLNSNDENSNAANSSDGNVNDDNGGGNINDDNGGSNINADNGGNSNDNNGSGSGGGNDNNTNGSGGGGGSGNDNNGGGGGGGGGNDNNGNGG